MSQREVVAAIAKIDQAWQSLGRLMSCRPLKFETGAVDSVGAGKYPVAANLEGLAGHAVYDLQYVLEFLDAGLDIRGADGAFGDRTAKALRVIVGHPDYDAMRDLPVLVNMTGACVADLLRKEETVSGTFGPVAVPPSAEEEIAEQAQGAIRPMLIDPVPEHFNQADPEWAGRMMGPDLPFQKGACGICSIAMFFNWISIQKGLKITPVVLDDWMDKNDGYLTLADGTETNMLVWGKMVDFGKEMLGLPFTYKQHGGKHKPLDHEYGLELARQLLNDWKIPVILRVKYRQTKSKQWFNHFVLAVGINEYGELRYLDPRNSVGHDLDHPQNNTGQTIVKGGYNIVAIEQFRKPDLA